MHIKNKIVLVTGGASGLGFEFTREFLRNGAAVSLEFLRSEFFCPSFKNIHLLSDKKLK